MTQITSPSINGDTKKKAIIRLLADGKYSDEEIKEMVGAGSVEYVRKVKCNYRKQLRASSQGKPAGGAAEGGSSRMKKNSAFPALLSVEDRKKLWAEFISAKPLPEIIRDHGLHPQQVRDEYDYYQQLEGVSLSSVQGVILSDLSVSMDYFMGGSLKDRFEEYERIVTEFKNKGQVGLQQFKDAVEMHKQISFLKGKDFVERLDEEPPFPWKRPLCKWCKQPIKGVVANPCYGWGEEVLALGDLWYHVACRSYAGR